MSDVFERLAPVAARERARMEQGDTLADVMKRLRDEGVRPIEAHIILRQIKLIPFNTAKEIVGDAYHDKCPDLDLDDLALLASIPRVCKAELSQNFKLAIAEEPAWAREIEVVRDDDDVFEIRFVRVPIQRR